MNPTAIAMTDAGRDASIPVPAIDEHGDERVQPIAAERPLTLYIDKREVVTLMTLGRQPELLVLGWLRNQRLIDRPERIRSIQVDWETDSVAVTTHEGIDNLVDGIPTVLDAKLPHKPQGVLDVLAGRDARIRHYQRHHPIRAKRLDEQREGGRRVHAPTDPDDHAARRSGGEVAAYEALEGGGHSLVVEVGHVLYGYARLGQNTRPEWMTPHSILYTGSRAPPARMLGRLRAPRGTGRSPPAYPQSP